MSKNKFEIGKHYRIVGNDSDGIHHYFQLGDEVMLTGMTRSCNHRYVGKSGLQQAVSDKDVEVVRTSEDELKPCPFCGGNDLELKDYTENVYGFWDYRIRCKTCRACMDSPSTAIVTPIENGIRQTRNDETKAKAKRELIINWNRRADDD